MPTVYAEKFLYKYRRELLPFVDQVGIPASYFSTPSAEIPVDKYGALLHLAAEKVDPLIGFEIGRDLVCSDLGVLGYAGAACRDVEQMLRIYARYIIVICHLNKFHLDLGQSLSAMSYRLPLLNIEHRRHDEEMVITAIVQLIRHATGRNFTPEYVEFSHPQPPASIARYTDFFGCNVYFNRGRNAFGFKNELLKWPFLTADPRHLEALEFYLADRLKIREGGGELLTRVKHLITISLSNEDVHIHNVARQIGMSARSLQRCLKNFNTAFSDLVDDCRKDMATAYVRSTGYALTEIAFMLGYKDLSSFSRAYKRWTGESPRETRSN